MKPSGNRCSLALWLLRQRIVEIVASKQLQQTPLPRTIPLSWRNLKMKRLVCILVLFMLASPAWANKKLTVRQLNDLLVSFQQNKKTDVEVATELKQIELTEELTRAVMNKIVPLAPGKFSIEQIYVLEARSAALPPPPSDLPATPAPDAATQKAILDKAVNYTTNTYAQLPPLTATKTTLRFQDDMKAIDACSGLVGCAQGAIDSSNFTHRATFIRYINSTETPVVSEHGTEKLPSKKDKTPWGANGMITLQEPDPSLGAILQEAQAAGSLQWLRWELVYGKPVAVYSFKVPITNSQFSVDICCFPKSTQTGRANFYNAMDANVVAGSDAAPGGGGGAAGNFQTDTSYDQHFKAKTPYHGEIFVDPATGIVLRLITQAEFKASGEVQQQDTRIDYGPVKIGARILILPVRTVVNTVVAPNGDSGAATFTARRTLFTSEYKDYQLAVQ